MDDNPDLVMPPKPTDDVSGSGAEFYNIDFDSERLKAGAVVSQSKPVPRSFTSRMVGLLVYCDVCQGGENLRGSSTGGLH